MTETSLDVWLHVCILMAHISCFYYFTIGMYKYLKITVFLEEKKIQNCYRQQDSQGNAVQHCM